ncbi:IS66 family transposase [Cohnella sp. GCM10020058]|uniref:IS66 family transposase n=1 Tax=Cohnella sp. GCM10020058 TaxID=3317330 RepID=UPI0036403674
MIDKKLIKQISHSDPETIEAFITSLVDQFTATIEQYTAKIEKLENRIKDLERQLGQNSRNSSKPPSSDGFRKPTNSRQPGGKKGAPKGHDGHTLLFSEAPDHVVHQTLSVCGACQASLEAVPSLDYERRQVFDLPAPRVVVTEYRSEKKRCPHCRCTQRALFPEGVNAATQYGDGFAAWTAYLSAFQMIPLARIGQLFADLTRYRPSDATLLSYLKVMHHRLAPAEQCVREALLKSDFLHCDETGFRVQDHEQWLHTASTADCTLFTVHPSRGSVGMKAGEILPSYTGTVMHDSYGAYFKDEFSFSHSLCCAHLLRECQGISEHDKHTWSTRMKTLLQESWKTASAHRKRGESLRQEHIQQMQQQYDEILKQGALEWSKDPVRPKTGPRGRKTKSKAANLGQRFLNYKDAILRFLYDAKAPFDNNQAERDIRMVKVKDKVSGCFRTEQGAKVFARVRGFISTLLKQQLPVLSSLSAALRGTFTFG